MWAKSLQRRWIHEIQIALLRRRAAITRAVLPNPSAGQSGSSPSIIDRALHHWDHVPPLDGGPGDHDHADSETATATPDDDDHQRSEKTRQKRLGERWPAPMLWLFPEPSVACRNLQQRLRVCSCRSLRQETGRPWQYHGTQGLTASQSRPADILPTDTQSRLGDLFATAAVPGRSAALDVCVASSIAAAARGDAAQAAFARKLTHYRNELGELRQQKNHCRPLVWTADGRPHPAVTRTLQYAADTASSCNGQHLSAKSMHHRWKHEIQVALRCRRAAMARILQHGQSGSSQASSTEPCTTGDVSLS